MNKERQDKWIQLFEEVVGRKPLPQEFMEGKESGFDFKLIRTIAGLDKGVENSPKEEEGSPQQQQKDSWLAAFEQTFNRQARAEELAYAQREGFNQASLNHLVENYRGQKKASQAAAKEAQVQAGAAFSQLEEVLPEASGQDPLPQAQTEAAALSQPEEDLLASESTQAAPASKSKKKLGIILASAAALLSLGGFGFYIHSTTGPKIPSQALKKAAEAKDYEQVASLLSSGSDKWTKQEAKSFLGYLEAEDINLANEMKKFQEKGDKAKLEDNQENTLLTLEEKGKKFGLFSEYQFKTHPVKVMVKTNLDQASIEVKDKKTLNLTKDQLTEVGNFHYASQELILKGKTDAGMVETALTFAPNKSKKNVLELNLQSESKQLRATLPADIVVTDATDIKLMVNKKEVSKNLDADLQLIPYQELEVYASFNLYGSTFTTDKKKVTVSADDNTIQVPLSLSSDVQKKIKEAEAAKKAKEEEEAKAAKEAEKQKEKVSSFLTDYRRDVFSSVSARNNSYAKYYDTSSDAYKDMVDWTSGGGVARAKIDYYTAGSLEIKEVKQEDGSILVSTYEDYVIHYTDKKADATVRKNKVYYLKPSGDSFSIYRIDVSDAG